MKIGKYKIEYAYKDDDWYRQCWGLFILTLNDEKKPPYSVFKLFNFVPNILPRTYYSLKKKRIKTFVGGSSLRTRWHFLKGYNYYKKYPDLEPTLKWFITGKK